MKIALSNTATITAARVLEKAGDLKQAVIVYKKLLRTPSTALPALNRLMIIYRKLKKYEEEKKVIDQAITIHLNHYQAVKPRNIKADNLSRQLNLALGLADKKGKTLYKPDEVLKLEKRKRFVLNKIG
ncbi:hypothetical protein [Ferruginibacter sp. HRS2-29]|uniref:hypothetical protein n=1 Tax=Ferruginibacter sp. HRS2-29 TaxID=2487334 RepID=UPI0020CF7A34|nr:hypothetical protein [Ferruginibacter sp. HRS2-29]MCP9749681.1 hypothetical protein [Ferruginibacter sp. HRS2-29]